MAKKVNEVLNNKPNTPEDELTDALEDMARVIALIEPDPSGLGWVGGLPVGTIEGGSGEAGEGCCGI